jgi:hypothetical protein
MPEKILYILGAGASSQALPLAKDIVSREGNILKPGLIKELKDLDLKTNFLDYRSDDNVYKLIPEIKERLTKISNDAERFGDVDTYAKYLYINDPGGNEFLQVKQGLSEYFSIKQVALGARDSRYLPWLVGIMENKKFPENVKILNWNYDFQVELAFAEFGFSEDVKHEGTGFSHSGLMLHYLPNLDPTYFDHAQLSLIHLNGIAGFLKQNGLYTAGIFQEKYRASPASAIQYFKDHPQNSQVNFAWEKNNNYLNPIMEHVLKMIEGTTILVVIGYSFPYYNRLIDKKIFEKFKNDGTLSKIYYQDPVLNGGQLIAQFDLVQDFPITHINQVGYFHIPFEY